MYSRTIFITAGNRTMISHHHSSAMSAISINVKFSLPSSDEEIPQSIENLFDATKCEVARLGLPPGVDAVKVRRNNDKNSIQINFESFSELYD